MRRAGQWFVARQATGLTRSSRIRTRRTPRLSRSFTPGIVSRSDKNNNSSSDSEGQEKVGGQDEGKTVPINIVKGAADPTVVSEADRPEWLNLAHLQSSLASYEDLLKRFNEDENSLSYKEFKRLWRLANIRKIKQQNAERAG